MKNQMKSNQPSSVIRQLSARTPRRFLLAPRRFLLAAGAVLLFVLIAAPAFAGYLGIGVSDVTSERLSALKLKEERGVEVVQVYPDTPAAKAGLKEHDVVLEYSGQRVESQEQFQRLVRETPADRSVVLRISRDGNTQQITVKVGQPPARDMITLPNGRGFVYRTPSPNSRNSEPFVFNLPNLPNMPNMPNMDELLKRRGVIALAGPRIGVQIDPVDGQLAEFFGVKTGGGLLVRSVDRDSAAEKAGIKVGDVIVKVGDEKVTNANELRSALREKQRSGKLDVPVTVVRDKKETPLTLKVEPPPTPAPARRGAGTPVRGARV